MVGQKVLYVPTVPPSQHSELIRGAQTWNNNNVYFYRSSYYYYCSTLRRGAALIAIESTAGVQ